MPNIDTTMDDLDAPEDHPAGFISLPDYIFQVAELHAERPVFSEEYVWASEFQSHRFTSIIGGPRRYTQLEAVVHSRLSPQTRAAMFPSKYHPGSHEDLSPKDCTYQAIADAVAHTCKYHAGTISGEYIKDTANDLTRLTGFSVAEHRDADPVRFARTVWLFAYLKKKRGSGIVGMLRAPDADTPPSLEISNPYAEGFKPQTPKRMDFHDVQVYLSLQLPLKNLERIEKCLPYLMPDMEKFIGSVRVEANLDSRSHQGNSQEPIQNLNSAARFYKQKLGELQTHSRPTCRPLDEALYIHAKTLEVSHYAGFRTVLRNLEFQRPDMPQLGVRGIENPSEMQLDEIDHEYSVEIFRIIAERHFPSPISSAKLDKAIKLARNVLRHYLPFATGSLLAIQRPIPFVTMCAAVIYSLQIGIDPEAHRYKPHIYGQGRVPTSIVTAIEGEINERHEEYEHIIVDAVDWYEAALLNRLPQQRALLEMRDAIEQGVAQLCETNDLDVLEQALAMMRKPINAAEVFA